MQNCHPSARCALGRTDQPGYNCALGTGQSHCPRESQPFPCPRAHGVHGLLLSIKSGAMIGWNHPGKEHELHRREGGSNHGAETSPGLQLPPAPEQSQTTLLQQSALMCTGCQDVRCFLLRGFCGAL